ncbi:hypothetical protein CW304_15040 [Bacillus sp. UFRGS-B20]|nr:hypothetical protein CW304_15040 [Bacillus sp. UFRGS-B20]
MKLKSPVSYVILLHQTVIISGIEASTLSACICKIPEDITRSNNHNQLLFDFVNTITAHIKGIPSS